jgi:hypothetical protein
LAERLVGSLAVLCRRDPLGDHAAARLDLVHRVEQVDGELRWQDPAQHVRVRTEEPMIDLSFSRKLPRSQEDGPDLVEFHGDQVLP